MNKVVQLFWCCFFDDVFIPFETSNFDPFFYPNTFSNKESIAQEDSLHNQLNNFISYPLIVWGGGVGGGY